MVFALLATTAPAAAILRIWPDGNVTLPTTTEHPEEWRATLQKTRVSERIKPD